MKTILVPTDYSENADHAFRFACVLGENTPLKILLFHWGEILILTSTPQHLYKGLYEEQKAIKLDQLKENSAKLVDGSLSSNVEIEYIIGDGADLEDAIIQTIKAHQVNLIVMGTKGASGLTKLFVGSNTATIIEKAEVLVIAVPANVQLNSIKKIGYASDLKDVSNEIGELVKFAGLFGAAIEIFHVYPSFPVFFEVNQENVDKLIAELIIKYPGQKFSIHIIQTYKDNDIVNGIEKYITGYKPDVLAMFTLKRTFFDKLFDSSKTEEVAFNTNVPLLTLKKSEDVAY